MNRILLLLTLFLTACGHVGENEIKTAYKACEPHGGVEYVEADMTWAWTFATCKDGTRIETNTEGALK